MPACESVRATGVACFVEQSKSRCKKKKKEETKREVNQGEWSE